MSELFTKQKVEKKFEILLGPQTFCSYICLIKIIISSTDTIVRVAENTVDEVTLQENREVRLEEDLILQLPFLLPEDGYSCDIVKGNLILEIKNR